MIHCIACLTPGFCLLHSLCVIKHWVEINCFEDPPSIGNTAYERAGVGVWFLAEEGTSGDGIFAYSW